MDEQTRVDRINTAIDRWNTIARNRRASFETLRDGLLELERQLRVIDHEYN